MRLENSVKNAKYNFIFLVIYMIFNFISRSFFIKILGIDILGINNIISSLLGFLNIAELGIAMAITYSLYKPLADKDNKKIEEIMYLFRYYYRRIAIVVLVVGIIISVFLNKFVKGQLNLNEVYIYYYLLLFNSVISYFFSYKQTLIIADQKQYLIIIITNTCKIIKVILQVIILIVLKSYIIWIILEILSNVISLLIISNKCDSLFLDINFENTYDLKVIKKKYNNIMSNIKNVFVHKIAGFIVYQTDSILISLFLSLKETGIYANYMMVINSFLAVFNTVMGSLTASIGNLVAENNDKKSYNIYKKIYILENFIATVVSFTLFKTINYFMNLWVGKDYIFNINIILILIINIYIQISRGATEKFKESYGLFWDKYAPIIEGMINLIISLLLVKKIGVIGLFIGTLFSNIIIVLLWKPYMLYKYGFKINPIKHVKIFFSCIFTTICSITISEFIIINLVNLFDINMYTIIGFLIHSFMTLSIIVVISMMLYLAQKDFRSLFKYVKKIFGNKFIKIEK